MMNKETRIMLKRLPMWKPIGKYDEKERPIVPEHCIVRDGYYLDLFDLDKLPKCDDFVIDPNRRPELTWSRDDDSALATVMFQINEARHKAVEEGNNHLADTLMCSEDWLKLLEHRLTVAGMRPIEEWYSNYRKLENSRRNREAR